MIIYNVGVLISEVVSSLKLLLELQKCPDYRGVLIIE